MRIYAQISMTSSGIYACVAQRCIIKKDQALLLDKVSNHQYLCQIAESVGWKRLWDHLLDHGPSAIMGMKNMVRVIAYPGHVVNKKCPVCDISELDQATLADHFITQHTRSDGSWKTLMDSLISMDPSFFSHVLCFVNTF